MVAWPLSRRLLTRGARSPFPALEEKFGSSSRDETKRTDRPRVSGETSSPLSSFFSSVPGTHWGGNGVHGLYSLSGRGSIPSWSGLTLFPQSESSLQVNLAYYSMYVCLWVVRLALKAGVIIE